MTVLISLLTPYANDGISYGFGYVFAGCNVAGMLIVYFFLYEPAGLGLENVDLMYSDKSVKAWKSKSWKPPGYITRGDKADDTGKATGSDYGEAEKREGTRESDQANVEYRS